MTATTAHVSTANAGKYLKQLCKHWSHKLEVDLQEDAGTVQFADAVVRMTATGSELAVTVEAENGEAMERIKDVVVAHLDRFAFREAPLDYRWFPTASS